MRRSQWLAATVAVLALVSAAPADAATRWFVELESAPAAEGTSRVALDAKHRRFTSDARAADIDYRERFAYGTLFNGVAITADESAIANIGVLDGVPPSIPSRP
jgi:minor extracellular serine protease Vpr